MTSSVLNDLQVPIVQAPLSGGPSTPELTLAASRAGAFGFLAAGYLTAGQLRDQVRRMHASSTGPFGVNLFVPGESTADERKLRAYSERIRPEAESVGAELGQASWSDDDWTAKLELVLGEKPAVVSFTFGCPHADVVAELRHRGIEVWVTVTEPDEAQAAADSGADALVLQGFEAGGHRASFVDQDGVGELGVLALIRLVSRRTRLPLVAAGGISDGHAVAAVLVAGAQAAQIGTALLDTIEAGTSPAHRERLRVGGHTSMTRAFTGKRARGIVNGFMQRNSAAAPAAYPQVHHLTAPMRAAARARRDSELINLWAGQAHGLIEHGLSAEQVIGRMAEEMKGALGRMTADGRLS